MSDVIKMVRPPPRNDKGEADAVREALYGYLIGKSVDTSSLPPLAKAYDAFRNGAGPVPDVPFEMLTALPLRAAHWAELADKMTVTQLLTHLGTLLRCGVLAETAARESVCARLDDACTIRCARVMPFAVLTALRMAPPSMPASILRALAEALEHAMSNVPAMDGRVVVLSDESTSMRGPFASTLRRSDVAWLIASAVAGKNPSAIVASFVESCAAPLRELAARGERADLVVVVSDDRAWAEYRAVGKTSMAAAWAAVREQNPRAKLVLVDLAPYDTSHVATAPDLLEVGGFSDVVFDVLASFAKHDLEPETYLRVIESVDLN
jgi:60 kDa SS-A/Ro ribonucleoprotein